MEAQNRIASVPTSRIAFVAALVLGLVVIVVMLLAGPARTAQPFPTSAPQMIVPTENQPPTAPSYLPIPQPGPVGP